MNEPDQTAPTAASGPTVDPDLLADHEPALLDVVRADLHDRMTRPQVERRDRYTITIDGHPIRATEAQEHQLRSMDAAAVDRFLTVMGHRTPRA